MVRSNHSAFSFEEPWLRWTRVPAQPSPLPGSATWRSEGDHPELLEQDALDEFSSMRRAIRRAAR